MLSNCQDWDFYYENKDKQWFKELCIERLGKFPTVSLIGIDLNCGELYPLIQLLGEEETSSEELIKGISEEELIKSSKLHYEQTSTKERLGISEEDFINEVQFEFRKCKSSPNRIRRYSIDNEDVNFIHRISQRDDEDYDFREIELETQLHFARKSRKRRVGNGKGFG